jgi:hypothetical protein
VTTSATSSSPVGTYAINVAPGSLSAANYNFPNLVPGALTVYQAATGLTVANASGTYGNTTTLTATLTAGGVGVSGETVSFTRNGTGVGSATTNSSGVAALSNVSLVGVNAGSYPTGIGASFAGDTNYATSTGTAALTVYQAATGLAVTNASGTYGGTTTLTATLTAGGVGVPGETVTFTLNDTSVGSDTTDVNGVATLSNVSLAGIIVGTYPTAIGASFAGDTNYVLSSGTAALTVNKAATGLAVASVDGNYGGTTTLTATLTDAGGAPLSGRSVSFTRNGTSVGSATTNNSGVATLSNVSLAGITPGTYPTGIGASFTVDTNYAASSGTATLTVNKAASGLAVAAASGTYGGTTTLTATLSANGVGVPGETVTFTLNGTNVGTATTDSSGVATLSNASLAGINAGSYATGIGASFAGDTNHATSTGTGALTVNKANQTIQWSTPADIGYGTPLSATQLDAMVTGVPGGSAPGALTYSLPAGTILPNGPHQALTVTAAGTANYNSATATVYINVLTAPQQASTLIQEVNALTPKFLNAGQDNALVVKLALKGNSGDIGKVDAFIAQVNSFLSTGVLTAVQADLLIQGADMLLVTLNLG